MLFDAALVREGVLGQEQHVVFDVVGAASEPCGLSVVVSRDRAILRDEVVYLQHAARQVRAVSRQLQTMGRAERPAATRDDDGPTVKQTQLRRPSEYRL